MCSHVNSRIPIHHCYNRKCQGGVLDWRHFWGCQQQEFMNLTRLPCCSSPWLSGIPHGCFLCLCSGRSATLGLSSPWPESQKHGIKRQLAHNCGENYRQWWRYGVNLSHKGEYQLLPCGPMDLLLPHIWFFTRSWKSWVKFLRFWRMARKERKEGKRREGGEGGREGRRMRERDRDRENTTWANTAQACTENELTQQARLPFLRKASYLRSWSLAGI